MAESRNLRALSARAERIERDRVRRVVDALSKKFAVEADVSRATKTLNHVVIPTSEPAASGLVSAISQLLAPFQAEPFPVVDENRLYVRIQRSNAPSDRAVGLATALAGAIIVASSVAIYVGAL